MEEGLSGIFELAVSQGIWAVLYIYLFFRMLKENKEREERYQSTIDRLSTNIETGIEKIHGTEGTVLSVPRLVIRFFPLMCMKMVVTVCFPRSSTAMAVGLLIPMMNLTGLPV